MGVAIVGLGTLLCTMAQQHTQLVMSIAVFCYKIQLHVRLVQESICSCNNIVHAFHVFPGIMACLHDSDTSKKYFHDLS